MGIQIAHVRNERWQSVQNALEKVKPNMEWVAIHDAARPCIAPQWVDSVFDGAEATGAAILATPIHGTIKLAGLKIDHRGNRSSRDHLWQAQTPQVFRKELLTKAFAQRGNPLPTDDAQLVEKQGWKCDLFWAAP